MAFDDDDTRIKRNNRTGELSDDPNGYKAYYGSHRRNNNLPDLEPERLVTIRDHRGEIIQLPLGLLDGGLARQEPTIVKKYRVTKSGIYLVGATRVDLIPVPRPGRQLIEREKVIREFKENFVGPMRPVGSPRGRGVTNFRRDFIGPPKP